MGVDFWHIFGGILSSHNNQFSFEIGGLSILDPDCQVIGLDNLTPDQRQGIDSVSNKFKWLSDQGLGRTSLIHHIIDTQNALPIKQRYYPVSPQIQKQMKEEIDRMLALDVIEESFSPWSSPLVMVKKPNGKIRLCLDSRKLNSVTKKDNYPLPYMSTILDRLGEARYLSSIDLREAFWQIPLTDASKEATAFVAPGIGFYQFKVLPYGLHNATQTMQRLMDRLFRHREDVFVYLDDVVIATPTFAKHIEVLNEVFEKLRDSGLTVNYEKCQFCLPRMSFLGYEVDEKGLHTSAKKVEAIMNFPKPVTVTQMRSFNGLASWYRRFVKDFATISAPLYELTKSKKKKEKLDWTPDADKAFNEVKTALCTAPVLATPNFDLPFFVHCDASQEGVGGVLTQVQEGEEHPIAFVSRKFNDAERNYSTTEQECLAVVFSIEKFRPYIEGYHFTVYTDHASLKWLMRLEHPSGRLARWCVKLQQFDFDILHKKGSENVVPDILSRMYTPEIGLLDFTPQEADAWYLQMLAKVRHAPEKYGQWAVQNEKLYKATDNADYGLQHWKLVVPDSAKAAIFAECHDHPKAGHFGIFKTQRRIAEKYYWPRMARDVKAYVSNCDVCKACKPAKTNKTYLMGKYKEVHEPWQMISIDLMGPLPRSSAGHAWLLVITDWFTKYPILTPLRQASAKKVVEVLEIKVFLEQRVPEIIIADNGSQFAGKEFNELLRRYQVPKFWKNALYHPQNNPTERTNRIIKTTMKAYINENHRKWDVLLPQIQLAMRTAVNEATGYSPYFLNTGRHYNSSGNDYTLNRKETNSPVSEDRAELVDGRLTKLAEVFTNVCKRMRAAYERNVTQYNKGKNKMEFQIGDIVWKRNYVLSDAIKHFTAKLAPRFIKCRVIDKKSDLIYLLETMDGQPLGAWHIKDLKPDR
jgi:RNase H-like domain found in reverse transcriptase/Reverse transcriptase (RNA-dependent DNA polymerase)/Integrase zinc binding domain/Integrase core domain